VFATSQTTNMIQRIPSVCSACIGRWSIASAHVRRARRTILWMHKKPDAPSEWPCTNEDRWSSALDERVTNDDEQRRTNHFSVRSSCVLHVSTRCDRAIRSTFQYFSLAQNMLKTRSPTRFSVAVKVGDQVCDHVGDLLKVGMLNLGDLKFLLHFMCFYKASALHS